MSRPPINPDKTTAGIALDPQTLERVIPESKRSDGTVRKQIKIRPGFTPQEDVRRFRGTKQAQLDANALPKGHIIGWAPPPQSTAASGSTTKPMSKSAKKNAKRREKKEEKKEVPENWDDNDDEGDEGISSNVKDSSANGASGNKLVKADDKPDWAAAPTSNSDKTPTTGATGPTSVDGLSSKLETMGVK